MKIAKNTNILITGASGFLGKHVVREFKAAGFTNLITPTHQEYDLTRMSQIRRLFQKHQPQIVIHLAARVGGIGANQANPGKFYYENIMMGTQLIEVCRIKKVQKLICLGTVCSYPKITPIPFKEKDLWDGYPEATNAPYGLAKKMLWVQCDAYKRQYGLNSIYLIPVNMYGPGDNFDPESSHVIPALIKKFFDAKKIASPTVTLWGDGSPSREFLYVKDAALAIRLATESHDSIDPINIGTGHEIKMKALAKLIGSMIGYKGKIVWDTDKPNGQPRRKLNTSKAYKAFGFKAKMDFETGLMRTITWYTKHSKTMSFNK